MKILIDVKYSKQAEIIMKELKNFNKEAFEREYFKEIIIGDKVIYNYTLEKVLKNKKKILLPERCK